MEVYKEFLQVTEDFISLIDSLDENEMNRKPTSEDWSPGQIGDHIVRSYASAEIMTGSKESTLRRPDEKVSTIKNIFTDFTIRMESPQAILPSEKLLDKQRLLVSLRNRTAQISTIIKTEKLSETCIDFAIPEYGAFTVLEWAWFNIYHTQRHVHQLKNVIQSIKR